MCENEREREKREKKKGEKENSKGSSTLSLSSSLSLAFPLCLCPRVSSQLHCNGGASPSCAPLPSARAIKAESASAFLRPLPKCVIGVALCKAPRAGVLAGLSKGGDCRRAKRVERGRDRERERKREKEREKRKKSERGENNSLFFLSFSLSLSPSLPLLRAAFPKDVYVHVQRTDPHCVRKRRSASEMAARGLDGRVRRKTRAAVSFLCVRGAAAAAGVAVRVLRNRPAQERGRARDGVGESATKEPPSAVHPGLGFFRLVSSVFSFSTLSFPFSSLFLSCSCS